MLGLLTDRMGPKNSDDGHDFDHHSAYMGFFGGTTLSELVLIGILLGVAGASFAVALPMASRWYPPHLQGVAMGIAGAGNSGTLISTLFGPRLAEMYGWHTVMGLALIPLSFVFLFYFHSKRCTKPAGPSAASVLFFSLSSENNMVFLPALCNYIRWFCRPFKFLEYFLCGPICDFKIHAGDFVTLCVAAGSFFRPVGGLIADKIGGMKVLLGLFALIGICLGAVSSLPALPVVIALLFVGMMCLGMGNGAVFQLVPQVFHKEIGIVTGIVGAAGGIGDSFTKRSWQFKRNDGLLYVWLLTISLLFLLSSSVWLSPSSNVKVIIQPTMSES